MHDHAITIIDTGYVRPGLCAAYLVESQGRAALIDCGTATCAQTVPKLSTTATPRAEPSGSGVPQPAFSAARLSTPRWRGWSLSSARR